MYAARFDATGQGEWLELMIADPRIASHGAYKFANQADVFINARLAADAVGATKMDRPEWGAVNYRNGEVYFALTNNNAANRTPSKTDPANPRTYMDLDGKKVRVTRMVTSSDSKSQATKHRPKPLPGTSSCSALKKTRTMPTCRA